jgi:hypothetical protein
MRGRIKMRSGTSLFKIGPGSSKIVMHSECDWQNPTGLADSVGIICWKAIVTRRL